MARFTDSQGRTWVFAIHVAAIKRVRTELGTDLLDSAAVEALINDFVAFTDVLFSLCHEQAEAGNITAESFGQAITGAELAEAIPAFVEAYSDFFPSQASAEKAASQVEAIAGQKPSPPPPSSGEASTSSPASSASTPAPSASGS